MYLNTLYPDYIIQLLNLMTLAQAALLTCEEGGLTARPLI